MYKLEEKLKLSEAGKGQPTIINNIIPGMMQTSTVPQKTGEDLKAEIKDLQQKLNDQKTAKKAAEEEEEEERKRKAAEEEERKRNAAEEEERKRKATEEAARKEEEELSTLKKNCEIELENNLDNKQKMQEELNTIIGSVQAAENKTDFEKIKKEANTKIEELNKKLEEKPV